MDMSHFYILTTVAALSIGVVSEQRDPQSSCMFGAEANCFISSYIMCGDERHHEIVSPTTDCNEMDCKCSSGNDLKSPLKLTITNETVGNLTVSFQIVDDLMHKQLTEVVLKVNNRLNETECQKKGNHFQDLMRKRLNLTMKSDSSNFTAVDTIFVNFTNVHTACYQVEVRHEDQSYNDKSVVSCPQYLATAHSRPIDKRDFGPPKVVCQFLEEGALNINLRPFINGSTDSNQFFSTIVDENNDTNFLYPNESNFKVLEDGILSYQYNSLKPGNYCHGIRYLDDRCLLSRRCDCVWRQRIMVFESTPRTALKGKIQESISFESLRESFGILIYPAIALFLSSLICSFYYIFYKEIHFSPPQIIIPTSSVCEIQEDPPTLTRKKIFLFYARDCKLFMGAMQQLRKVLSLNSCEVFDMWDPPLIEKIRLNPNKFVQSHISALDTTTILVTSDCAKFIHDDYCEKISAHYIEPEEFDDLFKYGIKLIEETRRCFVVTLSSQTSHEQSDVIDLSFLNKLEIYRLPLHLERLIRDIHGVRQFIQVAGVSECRQFNTLVENLREFKYENPGHVLNEIISVTPGNTDTSMVQVH